MSNKILSVQYILILVLFFILNSSCNQTTPHKHILIIQSYEAGLPAYKKMKNIFAEQLRKGDIHAEVHTLYLDGTKKTEKKQAKEVLSPLAECSIRLRTKNWFLP